MLSTPGVTAQLFIIQYVQVGPEKKSKERKQGDSEKVKRVCQRAEYVYDARHPNLVDCCLDSAPSSV